jgi:hypothetical protein
MGNFFNNGPTFLKLIIRVRISYINKHLEKKIVDLKTGFLRIFFWKFIEVKWTILNIMIYMYIFNEKKL